MNLISTRLEQKELFFDLKSKMNKEYTSGWYVIFKDDICLYVGQSNNLPSRIATHLKGKYSTADKILIYHSYEKKGASLDNIEKYLMSIFKPIENVLVDFSLKFGHKDIDCESGVMYAIESYDNIEASNEICTKMISSYNECIILDGKEGLLVDNDFEPTLYTMPKVTSFLLKTITEINKYKGI